MCRSHTVKAAVILLLLFLSCGCVRPDPPDNVIRYTVNVTEDGVIEMSGNISQLDFGGVPAGSATEKIIGFDGNGIMQLYCTGEIAHWTTLRPNKFNLDGHQNVTVRIDVPSGAKVGRYESIIVN